MKFKLVLLHFVRDVGFELFGQFRVEKILLCDNWQVCIYHIFNFFYVKGFVLWMSKIIIERFFFESFTIITLLINGLLNISVLHGCSDHIDCRTTVKFFIYFYLLLAYMRDLTYLYVHLNFCIYIYIYRQTCLIIVVLDFDYPEKENEMWNKEKSRKMQQLKAEMAERVMHGCMQNVAMQYFSICNCLCGLVYGCVHIFCVRPNVNSQDKSSNHMVSCHSYLLLKVM